MFLVAETSHGTSGDSGKGRRESMCIYMAVHWQKLLSQACIKENDMIHENISKAQTQVTFWKSNEKSSDQRGGSQAGNSPAGPTGLGGPGMDGLVGAIIAGGPFAVGGPWGGPGAEGPLAKGGRAPAQTAAAQSACKSCSSHCLISFCCEFFLICLQIGRAHV